MKTMFVILALVLCTGLSAQQVVSTAGSTYVNNGGSLSYTMGEGVAQTLTKGDKILTQGFHQTTISVATERVIKDLGFSIEAFPNPTSDFLNLRIEKETLQGLHFLLFDMSGKLLSKRAIERSETTVPVQQLSVGFYLLKVQEGTKELKTFKIIKQ